ncbi:MAG: alginate export family protein [Verrucomicrobiota bacterium]|jgi:hypothetical protein
MNPTRLLTTLALAGSLALGRAQSNTAASAAAATPPPAPAPSAAEQTINDIKNPVPWLTWGGDLRLRDEYFNNALSLGAPNGGIGFGNVHEQEYLRFRGRLWASLMPTNDLTFNVRLAAEPREFIKSSTFDTFYQEEGPQWRYGILDTLNVQWKNPFHLPATLTVGRQDIFLGDGFLVGDGTPEDGSFTSFLDSARLTYKLDDLHTTIDAIGLIQDARPDGWLPTLGPSTATGDHVEPLLLTDQNEKGAILWVANKSLPYANLDGYFMYKHDSRLNDPVTFGDNADIYTLGGRVSGLVAEQWKYSLEGAYQFGRKQDPDLNDGGANLFLAPAAQSTGFRGLNAYALNGKLTYLFKDPLNDQLSLSCEFLSGDNPNTKSDEMFDVLWGRWPSWSEMYNIYSYVQETRVGQTANLIRFGPTWTLNPMPKMELSSSYFMLLADQETPTRDLNNAFGVPPAAGTDAFSRAGNDRGQYIQAVLKYKFNQHLSGHLWSEFLFPGDFYVNHQMMSFLRAEVMLTF